MHFAVLGKERQIASDYLSEASVADLEVKYGCSSSVIKRVLREQAVPTRAGNGGSRRKIGREVKIIESYLSGFGCDKVAADFGISIGTVSNILKRNGVPARHFREYSEEEELRVVDRYLVGKRSTTEIAHEMGTSMSMILKILERRNVPRRALATVCKRKPVVFRDGSGRLFDMKSSYEIGYAEYLDLNGIPWDYESRRFSLGVVGKREWTYTPDFYLKNSDEYVDVKGFFFPKQVTRIEMFRKLHPDIRFSILGEKDLTSLGVDIRRRFSGTRIKHGLTCSPSKEQFFDANLVNSVKLPTGNAVDNTEPSREKSRKV